MLAADHPNIDGARDICRAIARGDAEPVSCSLSCSSLLRGRSECEASRLFGEAPMITDACRASWNSSEHISTEISPWLTFGDMCEPRAFCAVVQGDGWAEPSLVRRPSVVRTGRTNVGRPSSVHIEYRRATARTVSFCGPKLTCQSGSPRSAAPRPRAAVSFSAPAPHGVSRPLSPSRPENRPSFFASPCLGVLSQ
jgi:hypothetical protein